MSSSNTPKTARKTSWSEITAANRGPEAAELHLLADAVVPERLVVMDCRIEQGPQETKPQADQGRRAGTSAAVATHPLLGELIFSCEGEVPLLFTENETNHERLFPGQKNESPYVKDGINDCVVRATKAQ